MGRQIVPQYSFNSGELSPKVYARGDFERYMKGVKTATNCYIQPHGPIARRSGSKYIGEVKTSANTTRLLPFIFDNEGDAILLEFGNNYIRFYKNGAVLGAPYEVTTTYTSAQVDGISYVQYGNSIYLAHPSHEPAVLTRITDTNWELNDLVLSPPPTYEDGVSPATTITPAATTGTSVNFTAGASTFVSGDIGRQIQHSEGNGIAVIRSLTSATVAVCDIVEDFPSTSAIASGDWKLDLSPIGSIEPSGSAAGSVITLTGRKTDLPEILNGDFLNSAASWQNISAGTGSAGWNSTNRTLELQGAGVGNEGIAEQPVTGNWTGNFTLKFDNAATVTYNIGTSSGATDVATGSKTAAIGNTVTFTLNNNQDTIYIGFETTLASVEIDNVELSATYDMFRSGDVDKYVLLNGGVVKIITYTDATSVDAVVEKGLNNSDETFNFTLEAPTWTSTRGYPSSVSIFQERLVLAGTTAEPTGVWMSETGIFGGFGAGPDDEDSIQITLASSSIKWLAANRDLIVGTSTSEIALLGASSGSAISPSSIRQIPRTFYGSESQEPVSIGQEIIFIQAMRRKIRTMSYDFASDGYKGDDILFVAEHITENGIKEMDYTDQPDSVIYAVDNDGDLIVGAYQRDQNVIGWTKYTTDGSYESIATIPNGAEDEIYVIVNRTIDGATARYIERFTFQEGDSQLDGFSDSYLTYSDPKAIYAISKADPGVVTTTSAHGFSNGDKIKIVAAGGMTEVNLNTYVVANVTSTTFELNDEYGANIDTTGFTDYTSGGNVHKLVTTVSGLSHLEGETVEIKADGAVHANKVVTSGAVTLDTDSYNVTVGLPYTTTIETLNLQFNTGEGIMQGQAQRRARTIVRVYNSTLPILNDTNFIPSRDGADLMDQSVPLYTGDLEYSATTWTTTGIVKFTVSEPLPFILQGIFGTVEANVK